MAALLAKFRIDFSDVIVIPDVTKRATDDTRQEHRQILDSLPEGRFSKFYFYVYFTYLHLVKLRGMVEA